ncbi:MAG TPA: trigger factor [Stellaceae bacterium]|nr:trigger factor [Stellaceae bacterium]
MQVTETSAEGLKREYRIVVPADDLETEITRRLGEISQSIRLPGFRPGKVPLGLLRQRYGNAVRGEVLESRVQASSAEAMQQHNLRPALPPQVEIVSAAEGTDLEYKMSVEVLPEMPALEFSDLGLEKLVADIPAEDVDKAIERMAEQQRKSEPVDRAAETGDIVVADLVGRIVGGEEIPGTRGENREFEVGGAGLLPGMSEKLAGIKAGEKRDLTHSFPEDWGNPDFAGKEAVFEVTCKEVRQRLPAVIDDSLATEVGLENLAELRDEIQQRMQRDYDGVARQRLKRDLLDKLAARYDFAVPPGMIEMEFNSIMQQYEAEKAAQKERAAAGDSPETAAEEVEPEDDEKSKAEFRQIAERRVRLGLLLAEVGRSNNITVSQEELNQALAREARNHPGYERQVIEYYRKNPEAFGNLRGPIYEDKVVDFMIELAKLDERKVTPMELLRFPDPGEAEAEAEAEPKKKAPARRARRKPAAEATE